MTSSSAARIVKEKSTLPDFLESLRRVRLQETRAANTPDEAGLRAFLDRLEGAADAARRSAAFLNVWSVAGLGRNEVRTASVLAWALDRRGSHGMGPAIFVALLDLLRSRGALDAFAGIDGDSSYAVHTELNPLGDRGNRIDLVIVGDDWLLFIEVKIDAPEGKSGEQTAIYNKAMNAMADALGKTHRRLLYLSERSATSDVKSFSWRDLGSAIRTTCGVSATFDDFSAKALLQFADHIDALH